MAIETTKQYIDALIKKYEKRSEEMSNYRTPTCKAITHELNSVIWDLKEI